VEVNSKEKVTTAIKLKVIFPSHIEKTIENKTYPSPLLFFSLKIANGTPPPHLFVPPNTHQP